MNEIRNKTTHYCATIGRVVSRDECGILDKCTPGCALQKIWIGGIFYGASPVGAGPRACPAKPAKPVKPGKKPAKPGKTAKPANPPQPPFSKGGRKQRPDVKNPSESEMNFTKTVKTAADIETKQAESVNSEPTTAHSPPIEATALNSPLEQGQGGVSPATAPPPWEIREEMSARGGFTVSYLVDPQTGEKIGRVCSQCGAPKLWGEYQKQSKHVSGHTSHCKACATKYSGWRRIGRAGDGPRACPGNGGSANPPQPPFSKGGSQAAASPFKPRAAGSEFVEWCIKNARLDGLPPMDSPLEAAPLNPPLESTSLNSPLEGGQGGVLPDAANIIRTAAGATPDININLNIKFPPPAPVQPPARRDPLDAAVSAAEETHRGLLYLQIRRDGSGEEPANAAMLMILSQMETACDRLRSYLWHQTIYGEAQNERKIA